MTKITTAKISFLQVISKPRIRKTNSFAEAEKVSHQKLCVNLAHAFSTRKHPNAKLYPNFIFLSAIFFVLPIHASQLHKIFFMGFVLSGQCKCLNVCVCDFTCQGFLKFRSMSDPSSNTLENVSEKPEVQHLHLTFRR